MYQELEDAVLKWYHQERSVGLNVRGIELQNAAQRLRTGSTGVPCLKTLRPERMKSRKVEKQARTVYLFCYVQMAKVRTG